MKDSNKRFFSMGGKSLAITAGVIIAVLLLNVLMSVLTVNGVWYLDVSPETRYTVYGANTRTNKWTKLYTLMDETVKYLDEKLKEADTTRDEPVTAEIVFCADPDMLMSNANSRYVYYTALQLEKAFPDRITVRTVDVWKNPSAVDAYRTNSYSSIYQSNVIVASGTEFRVCTLRSFYTYDDSTSTDPWAYNGEKQFVKQILAVTRAESPIACLTVNHGEPFAGLDLNDCDHWAEYSAFIKVIRGAGYEVRFLDLATEEIPENCRLIITYDPQTDFKSAFGDGVENSETIKLDRFLDNAYSYMVFFDADTPNLPNLETYLEKWGISYDRKDGDAYALTETVNTQKISTDGTVMAGVYAEAGLGYSAVADMLSVGEAPKVAFGNAVPIAYTYDLTYVRVDDDNDVAYTYGSYYKNSVSREIYTMFSTSSQANAFVKTNGVVTSEGKTGKFNLLTLTTEGRTIGEGQGYTTVNDASYVVAVGSTDLVKDVYLNGTSYGNTDMLLSTLRAVGREVLPVGIAFLTIPEDAIGEDFQDNNYNQTAMICLASILPAIALVTCGYVLIRRKKRH